ncbi:DUF3810 domain-containing protein [Pedobacter sp. L105]|uniref:DUF3810 domain-containing protein n=1 Tax=Pedobacter sp. L105 TaxID=1641871 RepID=UPI00131C9923|nr:DUF3810 domain-containing protein [Pedobacter sp. L105]
MSPLTRNKTRRLGILFSIAVLIFLFGLSSTAVESVYSEGLYQYTSVAQRFISSKVPFGLGDLLYALLILYCLWSIFSVIQKAYRKQINKQLIIFRLSSFLLWVYIVFKLIWGLNYSRPSVSRQLGISNKKYTTEELILLGDFLIKKINKAGEQVTTHHAQKTFTIKELESRAKFSYDKLALINPFFRYHNPAVKPVLSEWLVTKIGIEGYYAPPSGEANVNMRLPSTELPFVTCHEISHELGIAREDEANLYGYLVSINSPDLYFRYSGYYNILRNVLFEIRIKSPEDFARLIKKINPATLADFQAEQDFWAKYNGDMSAYMNTALDKFLKINNQKKGTDSYQDIVLWVFNLHRFEIEMVPGKKQLQRSPLIPLDSN